MNNNEYNDLLNKSVCDFDAFENKLKHAYFKWKNLPKPNNGSSDDEDKGKILEK